MFVESDGAATEKAGAVLATLLRARRTNYKG